MSAGSSRSEMERSPRQAGEEEAAAKDTPEVGLSAPVETACLVWLIHAVVQCDN